VGNALWENGVVLHAADWITPSLDTPLTPGLSLEYIRALPVTIATEGITLTRLSTASRVGEVLAQAGLPPQGLDYSIPAENAPLPADRLIYLVRVREEVQIEQAPVAFETSYQAAPEIEIDQRAVLQAGAYGLSARRVRLRYENGAEVSRSTEAEWLVQPPQDQIIGYGTQIVQHTINTDDGIITYWRALQMYAVSYHPGETGSNITASGQEVRKGLAAVDIRYIPFGTQMYVPGYGPALAADTGGGVVGRMIDLAYPTDEYVAWHEYVTVYFLWPPPANIVYIIP
jgi:3D (Asp-Asp-Asp) domain-containing protein